jgi:hypothetical protein
LWGTQQKALALGASQAHQSDKLVLGLDPLGDDIQLKGVRQRDHGLHDLGISPAVFNAADE